MTQDKSLPRAAEISIVPAAEAPDGLDWRPVVPGKPIKVRGVICNETREGVMAEDDIPPADAGETGDDLETVTVLLAEAKTGLEEASDALTTLSDVAVRMELALRMINHFAMGPIALPESGMVRDWIKDWIEGRNHGPVGGPMLWPAASKLACAQLRGWGFTRSEGNPGYVVLRRRPSGGEAVQ